VSEKSSLEMNEVEFLHYMDRRFNQANLRFSVAEMDRLAMIAESEFTWAGIKGDVSPDPKLFHTLMKAARDKLGYNMTIPELIAENEQVIEDCDRQIAEDRRIGERRLNDTGHRVEMPTGALRERATGKGRFDAISPIALERLALHMELADIKYRQGGGCRNWEKGMPLSWYEDGAKRHLNQWRLGDRSEDHLSAALWNVMCLIHTEEMIHAGHLPVELADIPFYNVTSKTVKTASKSD